MAIVKTTTQNNTAPNGSTPNGEAPVAATAVDRTRSVVNQGGTVVRRQPRTPGAVRPSAQRGTISTAPANPRSFLADTRAELQKVVWPTVDDVRSGTIVTIGLLIVFGMYIFGLDFLVDKLFHALGLFPK